MRVPSTTRQSTERASSDKIALLRDGRSEGNRCDLFAGIFRVSLGVADAPNSVDVVPLCENRLILVSMFATFVCQATLIEVSSSTFPPCTGALHVLVALNAPVVSLCPEKLKTKPMVHRVNRVSMC